MGCMARGGIGCESIILWMIAVGVWVVLHKHRGPSGSVPSGPATETLTHASQVPGAFAAMKSVERANLWTRPAADVASRNYRRHGFAWILRRLGATEDQLNGLANF